MWWLWDDKLNLFLCTESTEMHKKIEAFQKCAAALQRVRFLLPSRSTRLSLRQHLQTARAVPHHSASGPGGWGPGCCPCGHQHSLSNNRSLAVPLLSWTWECSRTSVPYSDFTDSPAAVWTLRLSSCFGDGRTSPSSRDTEMRFCVIVFLRLQLPICKKTWRLHH